MHTRIKHWLIPIGLAVILSTWMLSGGSARQPLRIVCDEWAPYQYEVDGVLTGFSADLIRAIHQRLDFPMDTIIALPWKRALNHLETGHADALFSANYTHDREMYAYYPKEVLIDTPWILWSRGTNRIHSLEALKGKRIGVVIGYSYTTEFWNFIETYCDVQKVTSDEINFKKLEIGRIDCTVAEFGNGTYLINKLDLQAVKPQPDVEIKRDGLYIMFNKKTVPDAFVEAFSNELKAFKLTPEYLALRKKYFGSSIR